MRRAPKRDADGWKHDDPHDPLSDANRPHAPRAKKDTRKWCKGKKGVEHKPELVLHHTATPGRKCQAWTWGNRSKWLCRHAIRCSGCGKYLREWLTQDECPDYRAPDGSPVCRCDEPRHMVLVGPVPGDAWIRCLGCKGMVAP